jgi:hypothetical protein
MATEADVSVVVLEIAADSCVRCPVLEARLREAEGVIDGYAQDEPPIVRGALDAQAEAESKYFAVKAEAIALISERTELKSALERMTAERDDLKRRFALARCSWCDEPVCEKHAAPGDHPGCGRSK